MATERAMADPAPRRPPYRELLTLYVRPEWRQSVLLLLLLLAATGLQLVNPQIARYYIDTARGGGALDALALAAAGYIGVAVATQLAKVADTYVAEDMGWLVTNRLRGDLAEHCLRLDMRFHNAHTPGEMIERIDGDVLMLTNFFTRFVTTLLGSVLLFVGILGVLYLEDWRIGLAFTLFLLVAAPVLYSLRNVATPHWDRAREASAELFGFLEERLGGAEDIRANGGGAYALRRLNGALRRNYATTRAASAIGTVTPFALYVLLGVGQALSFGVAGPLAVSGAITLGTVYMIFAYSLVLVLPLQQLADQIDDLQRASAGLARVQQLRAARSPIRDGSGAVPPSGAPAVAFERVSFGYDAAEPVLREISFRLEPGRVLGLLGRTGSGKTTVTRLLARFYDPDGGAVRLGNTDLREFRLGDLRRRVGMVTQDVQLFHASVRDNLTFFDPGVRDERLAEVLEGLGLGPWLRALPEGLDTPLAGSEELSAGQAQLLAFARVFLEDPGLVILDEATSRLDPETTRLVERAVDSLLEGRTAIVVAHRLETVERADEILILEDGRVAEHGERAVLAADASSRFGRLLRTGLEEVLV